MSIERICCIIDFDGFSFRNYVNSSTYKSEFLIREIGYVRIDPKYGTFMAKSYRFNLTFFDFRHCKDAWTAINYETRHITGLSFKPTKNEEVHSYDDRFKIIKCIYKTCLQPGRDVVAFKAGIWEKNILKELYLPCLDLRDYGCPSYEELVERKIVFSQLIDCGYHKGISDARKIVHCPRAEVTAFRDWVQLYHPVWILNRESPLCGSTEESLPSASRVDSFSDVSTSSDCCN